MAIKFATGLRLCNVGIADHHRPLGGAAPPHGLAQSGSSRQAGNSQRCTCKGALTEENQETQLKNKP